MKLNINGKSIELNIEDLKKAIESNEESFEVKTDLVVRTSQEEETYTTNLRKEGTAIGAEIGRKEVLKGLGIDGEGIHKSDEKSIEAINGFVSSKVSEEMEKAKIEPNKKVEELTKDLETLRTSLKEKESALVASNNEFNSYKKQQTINGRLRELIPENTVIPKKDVLKLMADSVKLDINENGQIFGIGDDGQPMKDEQLNLLGVDKIVNNYFDANQHYLTTPTGGAGGGDSSGGDGKQTLESFTKEMQDAGHSVNGEQFNKIMSERIEAGTLDLS